MNDIDYKNLGKRIRFYRTQKGMTQQRLAEIVDIVPSNVSHIERGTNKVSLPTLVRIANTLEVSIDQLLCTSLEVSSYNLNEDIAKLLEDCSDKEIDAIADIIKVVKSSLRNKQ